MSLDEALQVAESNNYQIRIAQSHVSEAGGRNLEGWGAFIPRLVVSESYMQSTDPVAVFGTKLRQGIFTADDFDLDTLNNPDAIDNFTTSVRLEQPLVNLDAIFGKTAAGHASKASGYALARAEEAVALEVERSYYGLILSHSNLETINNAVKSAMTHYNEVRAAHGKGLVSEADLLASQVRLAEIEEQQLTARLNIANANDHLKFVMGIEEDVEIVPTDSLVIDESHFAVEELPPDTIPTNRADLVALRFQSEAADRGVWMRRSEWIPRLNAFGVTEWNSDEIFNTRHNNWTFGFLLEWSLLDGLGQWGRKQQADAKSAAARAQYREAKTKSNLEIRRAYRALLTAKERMSVAEKAVTHSRESLRIGEARFQEGLERVSDLLTRETAYTNAQLRLQRAKHDFKVARSELQFFLGSNGGSIEE
jgi:outer membrane protein TolC